MAPSRLYSYHRIIRKLRLSLLDACDFQCLYCMPEQKKFSLKKDHIEKEKLLSCVKFLIDLGIEEIRITGGEPSLSPNLLYMANELSNLNLKKLGLTSNGVQLKKLLPDLANTNCRHLNISLDSLVPEKFAFITKTNHLEDVLESVFWAKELGFSIKINTVIMRNINEDEIEHFIEFSREHQIEVRFLELMNIGVARNHFGKFFVSADKIIEKMRMKKSWEIEKKEWDSTSFNFLSNDGARIGIIASETKSFCNSCSRLRIDSKGRLRACLMGTEFLDLTKISKDNWFSEISHFLKLKPLDRVEETPHFMNQLGG